MTEEEKLYYNILDDLNKDLLNTIIDTLKEKYKVKNISMLTELSNTIVEQFLHDENIVIYGEYKNKILTPYAIMRYTLLYSEEQTLCEKITDFLDKHVNKDRYSYTLRKNLSNEILFKPALSRSELKVKYIYKVDDDKFDFYLMGHNQHFPVSFITINTLLTCAGNDNLYITDNKLTKNSTNNLQSVSNFQDSHIELSFNGMKITIKKQ